MNTDIDKEINVAISHALHLEISKRMHDQESFKLTIKQNNKSSWNIRTQSMRKSPR